MLPRNRTAGVLTSLVFGNSRNFLQADVQIWAVANMASFCTPKRLHQRRWGLRYTARLGFVAQDSTQDRQSRQTCIARHGWLSCAVHGLCTDLARAGMPDDRIDVNLAGSGATVHSFTAATWNVLADGLAQGGGWLYVRLCYQMPMFSFAEYGAHLFH